MAVSESADDSSNASPLSWSEPLPSDAAALTYDDIPLSTPASQMTAGTPGDDEWDAPDAERRRMAAMERPSEPAIELGTITAVLGDQATAVIDRAGIACASTSQDIAIRTAGQVGSQVKVRVENRWVVASIKTIRAAGDDGHLQADLDFIGEGRAREGSDGFTEFRRGVTHRPLPGSRLMSVTSEDLEQVFAPSSRPHITIGAVHPTDYVSAALFIDPLLSRHFAVLGSTGTGKSTTTALLLRRIIEQAPHGHIVMLDPHGEYATAFADVGQVYDVSNLQLPYWLMNFEEHVEVLIGQRTPEREADVDILQRCLLSARSRSRLAGEMEKVTVDSPVPYLLSDLITAVSVQMGKLDKAEQVGPYLRLKTKLEELRTDPRYGFMFSGMQVHDTFSAIMAQLLRMPADGRPISIINLAGVPSDITNVVVALMSRLVFDFATWTPFEERRPILLVCEEAHRYVPAERLDNYGSARRNLERIAKEGRKYGISLGLISQRPADLSEAVLSQCGTIITMRLNNDRDQHIVRSAMSEGARGFFETIPTLRNRECIVCGEGVAVPMRVRIDPLKPGHRPASDDPVFTAAWQEGSASMALIQRSIKRWRLQMR